MMPMLFQYEDVMGFFSKDITTMDDLFVHALRDIYYAEQQILTALPDMVEKATEPNLKQAFSIHLRETEGQVARLDQIFTKLNLDAHGVDCPAIDGIIEEAQEISGEIESHDVLNAALVAAAQAVEHYEIARYGTLIAWARLAGKTDIAALLQQTLDEEKATDVKLTGLAESRINERAASA
jgi:ferritin-like metal-binding protein YciE